MPCHPELPLSCQSALAQVSSRDAHLLSPSRSALWISGGWVLLASMAWAPTAHLWRELDWIVYHAAQGLLLDYAPIAPLFALLNLHPAGNLVMDGAFAAVGLPWLWMVANRAELARHLGMLSYYVVAWRITMSLLNRWLFATVLRWESLSPSLLEAPQVNLRDLLPGANVKVFATGTFPSDHAMQLLFLLLVMWRFGGSMRLPIGIVCLFFCLPRLMSGAHWLSDVAVGGLGIAAVAFGFWFAAPIAGPCMRPFEWVWRRLLRVQHLPAPGYESQ